MTVSKTRESGMGLSGVLFLIFLVLKLMGVSEMNWIWVFSPLWIPAGIVVLIFLVVLLGGLFLSVPASIVKKVRSSRLDDYKD